MKSLTQRASTSCSGDRPMSGKRSESRTSESGMRMWWSYIGWRVKEGSGVLLDKAGEALRRLGIERLGLYLARPTGTSPTALPGKLWAVSSAICVAGSDVPTNQRLEAGDVSAGTAVRAHRSQARSGASTSELVGPAIRRRRFDFRDLRLRDREGVEVDGVDPPLAIRTLALPPQLTRKQEVRNRDTQSMASANAGFVHRLLEAWNRSDLDAILPFRPRVRGCLPARGPRAWSLPRSRRAEAVGRGIPGRVGVPPLGGCGDRGCRRQGGRNAPSGWPGDRQRRRDGRDRCTRLYDPGGKDRSLAELL